MSITELPFSGRVAGGVGWQVAGVVDVLDEEAIAAVGVVLVGQEVGGAEGEAQGDLERFGAHTGDR